MAAPHTVAAADHTHTHAHTHAPTGAAASSAADVVTKPATAAQKSVLLMFDDPRFCPRGFAELQAWRDGFPVARDRFRDSDLLRFLLAREGRAEAAKTQLAETLVWRAELAAKHASTTCTLCEVDPSSHSFQPIGLDTHARPIIYGCPARGFNTQVDGIMTHVVHALEHVLHRDDAAHQWVWCVDYSGFGFSQAMQGQLALTLVRTFSAHMPERLGKILLLNPPRVWDILLGVISPILDARTRSKLVMVRGSREDIAKTLEESHGFPRASAQWVCAVMSMDIKPRSLPPLEDEWYDLMLPGLRRGAVFRSRSSESDDPV